MESHVVWIFLGSRCSASFYQVLSPQKPKIQIPVRPPEPKDKELLCRFMCHCWTVTQTTLQSRVRANVFLSLSSPLYNIMFAPCSAVSCSVLSLISPRQESRQSLPFPRIISFSVLLFYKPCMLSIWIYALNIFPYLSSILSLSFSFF